MTQADYLIPDQITFLWLHKGAHMLT